MSDPNGDAQAILTEAATRLLAVGCADPGEVPSGVRLRCLSAAEQLRSVGARPDRDWRAVTGAGVRAVVTQAREWLRQLCNGAADAETIAAVLRLLDNVLAELG